MGDSKNTQQTIKPNQNSNSKIKNNKLIEINNQDIKKPFENNKE
jgi:hypothetical protein